MTFTSEQIADMIFSEIADYEDFVAPYGNFTDGLILEEFCVTRHNVTYWVQVATDKRTGEIVDFHVSDEERLTWMVG